MFTLARGANDVPDAPSGLRLGFDLVQISQVAQSLSHFGSRYEERIFTVDELAYARQGEAVHAERLAARFAAKEAVIKALGLGDEGIAWREIEVLRHESGHCDVRLHGRTAQLARETGLQHIWLSLSHDGDYAGAVVAATTTSPNHQEEIA